MDTLQKLQDFLDKCHIRWVIPSSPDYGELRQQYIINSTAVPLLIARPKSAEEVTQIVSYAVAEKIEISVRSGGHDLFGRCYIQDALAIDMRDISFVNVDASGSYATIGGGVLSGSLAAELAQQNLATALGSIPSVGYVGWATHGGYGPFVGNYGMGVDQILGAKVVNHEGMLIDGDEKMLQVVRGGGGTLGVIVEMKIRVYPLNRILAGMVVFKSTDLASTIQRFHTSHMTLIKTENCVALGVQQNVLNTPMGKCFAVGFMWSSSDLELGQSYLDKITSFGEVAHNGVKETTVPEWMDEIAKFAPKATYGRTCTINVLELTQKVVDTIIAEVIRMPQDPSTLFSIHELQGPSATAKTDSVFGPREAHYCLEFIATSSDQERTKAAWEWALSFQTAIRTVDPQNALKSTYVSLTPPEEAHSPTIYGDNWLKLVEIKKQYDPDNVFKHALPQFGKSDG